MMPSQGPNTATKASSKHTAEMSRAAKTAVNTPHTTPRFLGSASQVLSDLFVFAARRGEFSLAFDVEALLWVGRIAWAAVARSAALPAELAEDEA